MEGKEATGLKELQKFVVRIIGNWYLISGFLLLSLLITVLINRYSTREHIVRFALVESEADDRSIFGSGRAYDPWWIAQEADVQKMLRVIKSEANISKTMEELDFCVTVFLKGDLKTSEVYRDKPLIFELDSSSVNVAYDRDINITLLSEPSYRVNVESNLREESNLSKTCNFDQNCRIDGMYFVLRKGEGRYLKTVGQYVIRLRRIKDLVEEYEDKLRVGVDKKTNKIFYYIHPLKYSQQGFGIPQKVRPGADSIRYSEKEP